MNFVKGRRGITATDADAWLRGLQELEERGEYFFSINRYVFSGTKP